METSRIDDQESLEQKPVNSIEQQESDPMIGLENASAELGKNFEKIDGLLESQGDIESLGGEDREKFSEFIGNLSAKAEKFKNMLSEMGKEAEEAFYTLATAGGLAYVGVSALTAHKFSDLIPPTAMLVMTGVAALGRTLNR